MDVGSGDSQQSHNENQQDAIVKIEHDSPDRDQACEWTAVPCVEQDPDKTFTPEEAKEMLLNYESHICLTSAALPKAGQVFMYDTEIIGNGWETDHYDWVDAGTETIPKDNPIMSMSTFYIKLENCVLGSKDFLRVVHKLIAHPKIILVSYIGDHTVFKQSTAKKRGRKSRQDHSDLDRAKALDFDEAVEMLENYEDCISRSVAQFPRAGEIYYYDTDSVGETWKFDGYYWRNSGKRTIPSKANPVFEKTYYTVRLTSNTYDGCTAFQRIVYKLITRPNIVLVQYAGDDGIWQAQVAADGKSGGRRPRLKAVVAFSPEELANPPQPVALTPTNHEMTWEEAASLLRQANDTGMYNRPCKPKAGEAYIFHLKGKLKESWKNDGYEWQAYSPIYFPRNKPKFSKKIFLCKTDDNPRGTKLFQKTVYNILIRVNVVLIHYTGDHTIALSETSGKRKAEDEIGNESSRLRSDVDGLEMVDDTEEEEESGVKDRALRLQEVIDILTHYEGNVSQSRAIRPKAGEIYIYDTNIIGDDWKCDNYVWRNSGSNFQPKKNPVVKKVFYSIRLDEKCRGGSKAFQKAVYSLLERPNIIMVHYIGDETVYQPLMHGNRKRGFVEYNRTCPSVMQSIKQAIVETNGTTPKNTLKHLEVAYELEDRPRNLDQIRNTKRLLTRKTKTPVRSSMQSSNIQHPSFTNTEAYSVEKQEIPPKYLVVESGMDENTGESQVIIQEHLGCAETIEEEDVEEVLELSEPVTTEHLMQENEIDQEPESQEDEGDTITTGLTNEDAAVNVKKEDEQFDQGVGESPLRSILLPKVEKSQPIIIQALDSRPEVCKVQMDLLNQQKRNLELQERKLLLEIKHLEEGKETVQIKTEKLNDGDNDTTDHNVMISDENVIYIENADDFNNLTEADDSEVIYIEAPPEGFDIAQYATEFVTGKLQNS